MSSNKSSRRECFQADATATGTETNDGNRLSRTQYGKRSTSTAQLSHQPTRNKAEADRMSREARRRIERQREQKAAARYFCRLQRGCVRRV